MVEPEKQSVTFYLQNPNIHVHVKGNVCKYATVCKQSLKALLVALEFYLPIFCLLPVCERASALLQLNV